MTSAICLYYYCIVYKVETKKGINAMKTKEELNALKEEVETLNKKLAELTEKELSQISGGENCYCSTCGRLLMVPGECPVCHPHGTKIR